MKPSHLLFNDGIRLKMEKIIINPLYNGGVRELEKGTIKSLEKQYRKWINNKYHPLIFPICCETCKFVGNEFWHCHNEESFKCYINVMPNDICSKWQPNEGLLIYLWIRKNKCNDLQKNDV